MHDRRDKDAGKIGQSHDARVPADAKPAGRKLAGRKLAGHESPHGESAASGPDRESDNAPSGTEGVTDHAADVEAAGGRTTRVWTRRAVGGGLLFSAAGLAFGLWPRREQAAPLPVKYDGGVVPLRAPEPELAGLAGKEPGAGSDQQTAPDAEEAPPLAHPPGGRAQIAIVIDDLGLGQDATRWATSLPGPLTLAFLPYGQALAAHTGRAKANGHEVIVHLPMDPGGRADPGPKALRLGQEGVELEQRLVWNLAQVADAAGVNNHMGSALTENAAAMTAVLTRLKQDGRYFLDSRTTARSVARTIAHRLDVPFAERDVFLDNDTNPQAIARQLAETEQLARRYGSAIAIGHPHRQTLKVLETWVGEARQRGIDLVPVSTVIATRGSALWRLARDRKRGAAS